MMLSALLLAATAACAAGAPASVAAAPAAAAVAQRAPEEQLRRILGRIRSKHEKEEREAIMGGAGDELRDAVTSTAGPEKRLLQDRLPGMAADPFDICRDLANCAQAPLSMHVEDDALIDDAFVALARPWIK